MYIQSKFQPRTFLSFAKPKSRQYGTHPFFGNTFNMPEILSKNINVAKDSVDELKKEAIGAALTNAINILKETEQKMIDHKLNDVNCGISINIGPISVSISKHIKIEKE
jgi:hypothetical protein